MCSYRPGAALFLAAILVSSTALPVFAEDRGPYIDPNGQPADTELVQRPSTVTSSSGFDFLRWLIALALPQSAGGSTNADGTPSEPGDPEDDRGPYIDPNGPA